MWVEPILILSLFGGLESHSEVVFLLGVAFIGAWVGELYGTGIEPGLAAIAPEISLLPQPHSF